MTPDLRNDIVKLLPRLRRFALGLCGKHEDADDLVQAACEKALTRLDQYQAGTRLDSWMFRIVQNQWIDLTRSRKTRGDPIDPEELPEIADDHAHRTVEERNHLTSVLHAMQQLPEEQRAVLMLVCVEELSYRDAATALEIPVGTVMSRLSRARLRLAELLNGANPVSESPPDLGAPQDASPSMP